MPSHNRSFIFTRTALSRGLFKPVEIRFELRHPETEALAGIFVITGRNAEWQPADGDCSFRIRRTFWGRRWNYAGTGEGREFARMGFSFFRQTIRLAEGGAYTMKLKQSGMFFRKRDYVHKAEFFREESLMLTITNHLKGKLFSAGTQVPMKGTIESDMPGMAELWGALLMFQSYFQMQQAAAAPGA